MNTDELVVRSQLIPPRLPRRWLRRARLDKLLAGAAETPLTIVCASAGYGKSMALASFAARGGWPTIWYSLHEGADDPPVFLLHLIAACRTYAPTVGTHALTLLGHHDHAVPPWERALDSLLNDLTTTLDDETLLVLDDYQLVDHHPEVRALVDRLIRQRPPLLHVVLGTRHWPQLAALATLQARGELLALGEADLAFTTEEIGALFAEVYDHALRQDELLMLGTQTDGWAIALQLVGQTASEQPTADKRESVLLPWSSPATHQGSESHEVLFEYLAQDVLAGQPEEIQRFLLRSSTLEELDEALCRHVLEETRPTVALRRIERRGLFLSALGGGHYRYHPLFHAFLQQQARARLPEWAKLHARAIDYFRATGQGESVLYHLMAIGDQPGVAAELESLAAHWIDNGRCVTLLGWLNRLPQTELEARPALLLAQGDAARLLARFDAALDAYAQAEHVFAAAGDLSGQARALRGQAEVYLDTVRPAFADDLLRRAFRTLPAQQREERGALLRLLAENRLNSGRAHQAARLYRAADRLSPPAPTSEAQPRLLLRLGYLDEARATLEADLPREDALLTPRRPEAHREVTLLLALICAMQGDQPAALRYANQGLAIARQLGSALSEAVAHSRLGHALQIGPAPDLVAANQHYLQAMLLADTFGVQRIKAEAYLGLALLHGFNGDLRAAHAAAREGLAIVESSGDAWMAATLLMALGAVSAAAGDPEAETWLTQASSHYTAGRDSYGQAVVLLWQAISHHRAGRIDQALASARTAITLAQRYGYAGLLSSPALFGPRDRMMVVPVLLAGRGDKQLGAYANELLAHGYPTIAADETTATYHPGITLRIASFERLRVWRSGDEVEARAWQRKKAQHLLALLLTNRHRWLLREQICDMLWPEDNKTEAETQFKVTLNALNAALEPARPPRTQPFYIRRQGGAYRFAPPDGVWIDVVEFERRLDSARRSTGTGSEQELVQAQTDLIAAVGLYQGDYLSEYLYEDWSREERERLAARYLEAATTLAELFLRRNQTTEAIRLCEVILGRDPCWEDAYVILMRAYGRQGKRRMVMSAYERCVRNLRTHLDAAPLAQTTHAYEEARAGQGVTPL